MTKVMQLGLYGVMYFSLYFASSLAFYDAVCEAKEKHMFETATAVCLIVLTVQLSFPFLTPARKFVLS